MSLSKFASALAIYPVMGNCVFSSGTTAGNVSEEQAAR